MYIKHDANIYARIKFTDMRKQCYSLASIAEEASENPTNGDVGIPEEPTFQSFKPLSTAPLA